MPAVRLDSVADNTNGVEMLLIDVVPGVIQNGELVGKG